jgi:hypothetical protein
MTALAFSATPVASGSGQRDPFIAALARYVEALHRRYPDGPDQMRAESLDARGNIPRMCKSERVSAA